MGTYREPDPHSGPGTAAGGTAEGSTGRKKSRTEDLVVWAPFPATVRGLDRQLRAFEEQTALESLGTRTLTLMLSREVEPGAALYVQVRLSTEPAEQGPAAEVAIHGTVLEMTPLEGGLWNVRVHFRQHRFLFAA